MNEPPKKLAMNQGQTDIGYFDDIGIFTPIHTLEIANEVIRRYDSHDALLDACKEMYETLIPSCSTIGCLTCVKRKAMKAKAKAAIALAE